MAYWFLLINVALSEKSYILITFKLRMCGGPIDYVLFHITKFNNLDLYDHMKSEKLVRHIYLYMLGIISFMMNFHKKICFL